MRSIFVTAGMLLLSSATVAEDLEARNLDWVLDKNGYQVKELTVPRTAETLAHYKSGVYIVGGVALQFTNVVGVKNREVEVNGKLTNRIARPGGDEWKLVK